jgi:hypothetical protein
MSISIENLSLSLETIAEQIKKAHNPSLVVPTESPNGNIIYHIYSDGEITSQKGGWAYLQRSEFNENYNKCKNKYNDLFPMKCGNYTYAMVTRQDAIQIQKILIEYEKQSMSL